MSGKKTDFLSRETRTPSRSGKLILSKLGKTYPRPYNPEKDKHRVGNSITGKAIPNQNIETNSIQIQNESTSQLRDFKTTAEGCYQKLLPD